MKKFFSKLKKSIVSHKIISFLIIVILIGAGYYTYKKVFAASATPQYVLAPAHLGNIVQTVTGSGQVSSENQLDITSEVSGKLLSISAKVGQTVKAGDLIATIDSHDALIDLQNTKISYAKLVEPSKPGDIVNAENSLTKSYSDSFSSINDSFLNFPTVMGGLKDILYGSNGYLNNYQNTLSETAKNYRDAAAASYEKTNLDYASLLVQYKNLSKTSSADTINDMLNRTADFTKEVSEVLKNTQAAITFIASSQPEYRASSATEAATNVSTWSGEINGNLSSLLSVKNSIASNIDSLYKLNEGPDKLDIQSQELTLQQKQRTYEKYFIRAPFEGVIGRIPVNVYDQVSGGTAVATISSNKKITNIPLNEVDAVKVSNGQKATLTFDAIEGLTVNGIVEQVDLVGTASQGVVTYNVKISFDGDDPRIRSGMSVDATIVTQEKNNILVVPASAVKTQGPINYVEVFGTSTPSTSERQGRMTTISSKIPPQRQIVKIGDSDDTNTEILSGLTEGQQIVVRTISGTSATTSTAPSIFSSLGGQRNAGQNANRAGGAGTANRTFIRQ